MINFNTEEFLTEKIADSLWELWRGWRKLSHPVKQGKITPEQYLILLFLHRDGPQRIKNIAARLGTGSSSATISVKRLEREGLVLRRRGEIDERTVTVYLTEHGNEVFNAWRLERRRTLSGLFELLGKEERHELNRLLLKVLSQLEKGDLSAGRNFRGS